MTATNVFNVSAGWQPVMREIGLDADAVFSHPLVRPWRRLADRENCTLDADLADGRHVRLHVKRYQPVQRPTTPGEEEQQGHDLLQSNQIPTANLVAWGTTDDGRSFVIWEDLAGFTPADKLIAASEYSPLLLRMTADLAARLHQAGLHHRDLYLCHFMVKPAGDQTEIRLIDPARVRRLPGFLTRVRWIVKDCAQYWYSTLKLPVTDAQRNAWLVRYCQQRQLPSTHLMRGMIESKVKRIARHDVKLNQLHPGRNISIPS